MSAESFKRKLTAILSADVKGYSRLMGENEAETVNTHGGFGHWRWDVALQPGDINTILSRHTGEPDKRENRKREKREREKCGVPKRTSERGGWKWY